MANHDRDEPKVTDELAELSSTLHQTTLAMLGGLRLATPLDSLEATGVIASTIQANFHHQGIKGNRILVA